METATAQNTRVLCGMSGGVDSSATAALLLDQGYEVVGVTLKLWPQDCVSRAEDKCCGPQAVMDARSVCHNLGIRYYLIDEAEDFQKHVIQYFADEYKAGRTPNPCVMCNEHLKFGRLIERADQLGADKIATGHFARVEQNSETGRYHLLRGRDERKDQTYFLFSLRQDQLSRAMFPLGEKTKDDTRDVARHCNLKTADKEESMEICFVPDNDYGGFLQKAGLAEKHRGAAGHTQGPLAVVHARQAAGNRAHRFRVRSLGAGPGEEKADPRVRGRTFAQALQVTGEELVVAVEQRHEFAAGCGEPIQDGPQLPLVRLPDHPYPRAAFIIGQDGRGGVRGTVVNDHQLIARCQLRECRIQGRRKEAGVIVVVHDHRDRGRSLLQHGQPQSSPSISKRRRLYGR